MQAAKFYNLVAISMKQSMLPLKRDLQPVQVGLFCRQLPNEIGVEISVDEQKPAVSL